MLIITPSIEYDTIYTPLIPMNTIISLMQLLQVTNTHHHITTDGLLMFISINTLVVI